MKYIKVNQKEAIELFQKGIPVWFKGIYSTQLISETTIQGICLTNEYNALINVVKKCDLTKLSRLLYES